MCRCTNWGSAATMIHSDARFTPLGPRCADAIRAGRMVRTHPLSVHVESPAGWWRGTPQLCARRPVSGLVRIRNEAGEPSKGDVLERREDLGPDDDHAEKQD